MSVIQLTNPNQSGSESQLVQVIEGDQNVRETLRGLLVSWGYQCQLFGSAEEFFAASPALPPACLLLCNRLPGMNAAELQSRLAQRENPLPVIALSNEPDVAEAVRLLRAGAHTVLPKSFEPEELHELINRALGASRVRAKVRQRYAEIGAAVEQLTPREKIVLQAVAAGQLNKVIASNLDVSVRTIEADRAKIVTKFGVETAGQVIGKYAQYNLLAELGGPEAI